jgi:hypothetical protein
VSALLVILTGPVLAGSIEGTDAAPPPPVRVVAKREEQHKFSGLMLTGQLKKPDLSYIYKRKGLRSEQIINIPDQFHDEIYEGAGRF